jgi:hypothetical protein
VPTLFPPVDFPSRAGPLCAPPGAGTGRRHRPDSLDCAIKVPLGHPVTQSRSRGGRGAGTRRTGKFGNRSQSDSNLFACYAARQCLTTYTLQRTTLNGGASLSSTIAICNKACTHCRGNPGSPASEPRFQPCIEGALVCHSATVKALCTVRVRYNHRLRRAGTRRVGHRVRFRRRPLTRTPARYTIRAVNPRGKALDRLKSVQWRGDGAAGAAGPGGNGASRVNGVRRESAAHGCGVLGRARSTSCTSRSRRHASGSRAVRSHLPKPLPFQVPFPGIATPGHMCPAPWRGT